jgi:NADH-quinone oxidoreductase subunit N
MLNDIVFFAPELIMLLAAFIAIIFGVCCKAENCASLVTLIIGFTISYAFILVQNQWQFDEISFGQMAISNQFIGYGKMLILSTSLLVLLLSYNWIRNLKNANFEYPIMMLFAIIGLCLVVSANDFMVFYVSVEMASLAMYVMAAYERDNSHSSEAGLKYFILGALTSSILLFGISLIYGFTGTIGFTDLAKVIAQGNHASSYGLITGLVLILIALCFKLSAAPFHMWTPDVYQGAPTPVVAFFSVVPKIAILIFLVRLIGVTFVDFITHWQQIVVFMSAISMLVGSVAGIAQKNLKRLIAYSSIGHIGYILLGVLPATQEAASHLLFYITIYSFMNLGFFALLLLLEKNGEAINNISDLAGLSSRCPKISIAMAILMFSMAGIPPFAGFFAKAFLLMAALKAGFTILSIFAVLCSVVACYYYIRIVKIMYFDEEEVELKITENKLLCGSVLLTSLAINIIVIMPSIILEPANIAAKALFP